MRTPDAAMAMIMMAPVLMGLDCQLPNLCGMTKPQAALPSRTP